jgi:hypothetical protein
VTLDTLDCAALLLASALVLAGLLLRESLRTEPPPRGTLPLAMRRRRRKP